MKEHRRCYTSMKLPLQVKIEDLFRSELQSWQKNTFQVRTLDDIERMTMILLQLVQIWSTHTYKYVYIYPLYIYIYIYTYLYVCVCLHWLVFIIWHFHNIDFFLSTVNSPFSSQEVVTNCCRRSWEQMQCLELENKALLFIPFHTRYAKLGNSWSHVPHNHLHTFKLHLSKKIIFFRGSITDCEANCTDSSL